MSKQRQDRMVAPRSLSTPENAAAPLLDREPSSPRDSRPRLALSDVPRPKDAHWLDVWRAGAVAALKEDTPAAARALTPPAGVGCRDCWQKGRDAAAKATEAAAR